MSDVSSVWMLAGCGQNFHKRCAYKIPNNCSLTKRRRSSGSKTDAFLSSGGSLAAETQVGIGGRLVHFLRCFPLDGALLNTGIFVGSSL